MPILRRSINISESPDINHILSYKANFVNRMMIEAVLKQTILYICKHSEKLSDFKWFATGRINIYRILL